MPVGAEEDALAIQAPHGIGVNADAVGEAGHIAPIGVHEVDFRVAVPFGYEDDLREYGCYIVPVNGPGRVVVCRRVLGYLQQARAFHLLQPQVPVTCLVRHEHYLVLVRRQLRAVVRRRAVRQPGGHILPPVVQVDFLIAVPGRGEDHGIALRCQHGRPELGGVAVGVDDDGMELYALRYVGSDVELMTDYGRHTQQLFALVPER